MAAITSTPKLPGLLRTVGVIDFLVAASAIGGGAALVADTTGASLGLPVEILAGSGFETFLVPGLLLAIFIGGSALVAGLAHIFRWRAAGQASLLAGVLLMGWIGVQVFLVGLVSWLQPFFFVVGLLQVALVFRALSLAARA